MTARPEDVASAWKRSTWSLRFEICIKSLSIPDEVPKGPLDFGKLSDFADHVAVVEVDAQSRRLPIRRLGPSLRQFFSRDPLDTDYLEIVAPSARQAAFDEAVLIVR